MVRLNVKVNLISLEQNYKLNSPLKVFSHSKTSRVIKVIFFHKFRVKIGGKCTRKIH